MRPLLWAALATTLLGSAVLALWPDADADADLAAPVVPVVPERHKPVATTTGPAAASAAALATPQLPTRAADWPAPTVAALAAWQGAAEPQVAVRAAGRASAPTDAASRPATPVFPYRWIGQLDDGAAPQLLLASAQRSVAVRLGATLDGRWRLQRSASGQLQALALPDGDALAVPGAPPATGP